MIRREEEEIKSHKKQVKKVINSISTTAFDRRITSYSINIFIHMKCNGESILSRFNDEIHYKGLFLFLCKEFATYVTCRER